jgi:hypothetical protein
MQTTVTLGPKERLTVAVREAGSGRSFITLGTEVLTVHLFGRAFDQLPALDQLIADLQDARERLDAGLLRDRLQQQEATRV